MKKYYLIKLVTNDKDQDGSAIAVYEGENADNRVKVAYHNTLASFHNADDVKYAVVEILDEYGRTLGGDNGYREIVDHRPAESEE